jgi:hypothetical protein
MPRWTCPRCGRQFGRARQSHDCQPGGTLDDSFVGCPPGFREAYDAIAAHLRTLGPLHEDAVQVGVFLKADRKLAEVRPMVRALELTVYLPRVVEHLRIGRRIPISAGTTVHAVKLHDATDIDDQLRDWLTEAYLAASDQ